MLILIVVIAILATNLFMGFFVAHYLGYGPQNFQELWTGIYLRPMGDSDAGKQARPISTAILEAMIETAIDPQLHPDDRPSIQSVVSKSEAPQRISDADLVWTMWHANLALHQNSLQSDRLRFREQGSHVASDAVEAQFLSKWQSRLHQVQPTEEIVWWKRYVSQWEATHKAWIDYRQSWSSLRRIQVAEQNYAEQLTTVVCEGDSCRRVSKKATSGSWWQRSPAELRTLAWVHDQLDHLHQEAFDHFVAARRQTTILHEKSLAWIRQTFQPETIESWAREFDSRWSGVGLNASITDPNKGDGFLVIIHTPENWVAEFVWGNVVVDAILRNRNEGLEQWFQAIPSQASAIRPLRQIVNDRTVAIWLQADNIQSARIAAWTIADKLERSCRKIEDQAIDLACRVMVVPLGPKKNAEIALQQTMRILNDSDQRIYEDPHGFVWSLEGKRPERVPRPDSLPLVESTVDLAQWYIGRPMATAFVATPVDVPPANGSAIADSPVAANNPVAANSSLATKTPSTVNSPSVVNGSATAIDDRVNHVPAAPNANSSLPTNDPEPTKGGNPSLPAVDDDGIEW
jgi:hypothetical protein